MKNINKNIPIVALQAIKNFFTTNNIYENDLFAVEDNGKFLLNLVDRDISSGFFFSVREYDSKHGLLIQYKPQSNTNTDSISIYSKPENIGVSFKSWHDCLQNYKELEVFFNDPYLQNLENDFLGDFVSTEEHINEPLNLNQIFYLDNILHRISESIVVYGTENNQAEIDEIITISESLRSNLANHTKEWIAKKFSNLFAKIVKQGPEIFKNIMQEVGKQVISQGIKFLFEHPEKFVG